MASRSTGRGLQCLLALLAAWAHAMGLYKTQAEADPSAALRLGAAGPVRAGGDRLRHDGQDPAGVCWVFIDNSLGVPIPALGWLNPMSAGAAMALSSLSVIVNSSLRRGYRRIPMWAQVRALAPPGLHRSS